MSCHRHSRGASLGIQPSDKPIDLWGMGIAHVQNGKIVEAWNAFDFVSLYRQIDATPALATLTLCR